jgi:plastocyanin
MYGQPPFTHTRHGSTVPVTRPAGAGGPVQHTSPYNRQLGAIVHRRTMTAFAVALCSLTIPGAAAAATKVVVAGPPLDKPPPGVPRDSEVNEFFPRTIKVHAGDAVSFRIAGFHTINFPKKGAGAPPFAAPDMTKPITGAVDAAGAPFWFNGQGTPIVPPVVGLGTGSGKPYTGAAELGSGVPQGSGKPKPFVVKFPKTGSFTYYCAVHPGMKATVGVVGKNKAVPSAKADAARVKAQLAAAIAGVKKLAKAKPAGGAATVTAGPDSSKGPVLLRFTPSTLTTKVGAPVTLQMTPGTTEDHTFTFAKDVKAAGKLADKTFVAPLPGTGTAGPPILAVDPKYAYPSEAPGSAASYDGTNHGDGFLNSGVLDGSSTTPFPQKFVMSFSRPGTYTYFCAIHTFMNGKITVTS